MADQINIGNFAKGLKSDRLPFNIDNDAFPYLFNMYSWRGRAKRKRGTTALARLQRQIKSVAVPTLPWQFGPLTDDGAGHYQLISGTWSQGPAQIPPVTFSLETTSSIVPGSINVLINGQTYTDPKLDGILIGSGGGSGFIIYSTGALTITGGPVGTLTGRFDYYPQLPVLGLEDFVSNSSSSKFPLLIAFDETYAYQLNQVGIPTFYSVSYYKNSNAPVIWTNTDDAQFWSTNYQSSFWVTNNKPGFHFARVTVVAGTGVMTFTDPNTALPVKNLVEGDVVWFNEWASSPQLNGATATVFTVIDRNTGQYLLNFNVAGPFNGSGIAVLLTNSIAGQDGIRWYDGDPTSTTGIPTGTPSTNPPSNAFINKGWVNFSPPLTAYPNKVSINDQTADTYYLVGALAILPFKDRILFFGPQIQSSTSSVIQKPLQDTVIWSWNGTPYYSSLVPVNPSSTETFDPRTYYVDQTGFGGYLSAGISKPLVTVMENEDVILIGFGGSGKKTRFVYTGNDLQPFLFYLINSQLPSSSTFSGVTLDAGGVEIGQYGITITTQQSSERVDEEIPDEVFKIQALNNGQNRVNAERDFFREWIYFSYPIGDGKESNFSWRFPAQTFMWNYKDLTWAIFRENFTHHGTFRRATQVSWNTLRFKTWDEWREPWDSGSSQALFPSVIAGNPQGFVVVKGENTGEAPQGAIANIALDAASAYTLITSYNHCLNSGDTGTGGLGDYISFAGSSIGLVTTVVDVNNFIVDIIFPSTANITGVTQATKAVVSLSWPSPATPPLINSYFVGQVVLINSVVGMTALNGNHYTVLGVTPTTITLNVDSTGFGAYVSGGTTTLDPYVPAGATYIGSATYSKLSQPLLQTKQFPLYWDQGRQVRLGPQKYLMDYTQDAQVTIDISLSQDPETIWNSGNIIPANGVKNSSLEYSQILFTCPEDTNLGLTPANVNLQQPTADSQYQIWHRLNTSLQGDTFQIGLTLSDIQMRNLTYATSEITLHGMVLNVSPGPLLA